MPLNVWREQRRPRKCHQVAAPEMRLVPRNTIPLLARVPRGRSPRHRGALRAQACRSVVLVHNLSLFLPCVRSSWFISLTPHFLFGLHLEILEILSGRFSVSSWVPKPSLPQISRMAPTPMCRTVSFRMERTMLSMQPKSRPNTWARSLINGR